jgi:phenylalanyl-tRNA synthetase beta chain
MLASHTWLRDFVPHDQSPQELHDLLSSHVATVDRMAQLRDDLASIVIGRVVEAARHPNSDHLWVTKVDDGTGELLDVVCGAPNVVAGTLYPFARTGTVMPGGLKIEKRKIRGETSNGMLCSARELGLGQDHDGILALDLDVPTGTPLLTAMPIGDTQLDIDVLPNRPDLLCHVGLAREVSALTGVALRQPPELAALTTPAATMHAGAEATANGITVQITDLADAPRFAAVVVRGVTVGASPQWLQDRLAAVGVRSISNVVDVTNYFLHGFGQPMHAYDLSTVQGATLVVRRGREGESVVTLDGVTRALSPEMLVIADAARAVGIAGVMGGRDTEVTPTTTDIVLEVASFEPGLVRRTRRAANVNTDASHRFERGTDPKAPAELAGVAAALIASLSGGRIDGAPLHVGHAAATRPSVALRPSRVTRLLGAPADAAGITELLSAIGFEITGSDDALTVTPPSWRHDVHRDVDLVEEVARLRGYDALPDTLAPFRPGNVPDHPLHVVGRRVRDRLVARGLYEVRPLPFVKGDDDNYLRVANPLADDEPHLRMSLLETLARRAEYNLARMQGDLRLFEIGSVFGRDGDEGVHEAIEVGCLLMGARRPPHFTEATPPAYDAWDAKALALELVGTAFPGRRVAAVAGDSTLLWRIQVDGAEKAWVRRVSLDAPVWAAPAFGVEVRLGALSVAPVAPPQQHAYQAAAVRVAATPVRYVALPTMPAADFDLAFLVPDAVHAGDVERALAKAAGDLLERIVLFDEFRGKGIADGHRSLAWRLTFRHPERTLNEKELAGRRQKLISTVEKEFGVVPRTA